MDSEDLLIFLSMWQIFVTLMHDDSVEISFLYWHWSCWLLCFLKLSCCLAPNVVFPCIIQQIKLFTPLNVSLSTSDGWLWDNASCVFFFVIYK